jgi:hypothetical protein
MKLKFVRESAWPLLVSTLMKSEAENATSEHLPNVCVTGETKKRLSWEKNRGISLTGVCRSGITRLC